MNLQTPNKMRKVIANGTHNVCLTAAVFYKNKLLIVKRSKDDEFLPNTWELVGGGLKVGESYSKGLLREIKEETNLVVTGSLNPYFCFTRPGVKHGKKVNVIEIFFTCSVKSIKSIKLSSEHSEYRFIEERELYSYFKKAEVFRQGVINGFKETGPKI